METEKTNLEHIYESIRQSVTDLGMSISLTNKARKSDSKNYRIVIELPSHPDFYVEVLGKEWNNDGRASLWFSDHREINKQIGRYPDGTLKWSHKNYSFNSELSDAEAQAIGLEKQPYCYTVRSLDIGFKATKSKKLLENDILPQLKKYRQVIELVSPRIDARIRKEEQTLRLMQDVAARTKYKHPILELRDERFDVAGIGEIRIDTFGRIEITRSVSESELRTMLEQLR